MIGVSSVPVALPLDSGDGGGGDDARKRFMAACFQHRLDEVESLAKEQPGLVGMARGDGTYPIHIACVKEDVELLRILLRGGADRNVKHGSSGASPLILAAQGGSHECVLALLDWGSSPPKLDAKTNKGQTAVFVAAKLNHPSILTLLLMKGADPEATGTLATPLFIAAKRGFAGIIRILIHYGANVNALCTVQKISPLEIAIINCREECIVALIQAGGRIFNMKEDPKALPKDEGPMTTGMTQIAATQLVLPFSKGSSPTTVATFPNGKSEKKEKGKKKIGQIKKRGSAAADGKPHTDSGSVDDDAPERDALLKSWRIALMALQEVVDAAEDGNSIPFTQSETNHRQKKPQLE